MPPPRVPNSDPLLSPPKRSPKGESFTSRLGVYLVGVALGLLIVGMIHQRRAAEAKRRQLNQVQYAPAPAQTPLVPPVNP